MKIILDETAGEGAIRVDRAWELFFGTRTKLEGGAGMPRFAEWLWDELGEKAGYLNRGSKGEATLAIPPLDKDALDFLVRLASFWADEIQLKRGGTESENLWMKPVVNVLDDLPTDGAERAQLHELDEEGSTERNLMPTLGPGRAFFSVQVIKEGESSARFHSHSALDEYYLILDGKGTLRFNGKEVGVRRGDLVGKPAGPDSSTHLIADKGEKLRVLDMEVWHQRAHFPKDVISDPDFAEIIMRGQGWEAVVPMDSLLPTEDSNMHYHEGYRRTKDGGWVPSKLRGHNKVRKEES